MKSSHGYEEDLVRFSIAYGFHFDGFGIAPTFIFDRVSGENIEAYGIAIHQGF